MPHVLDKEEVMVQEATFTEMWALLPTWLCVDAPMEEELISFLRAVALCKVFLLSMLFSLLERLTDWRTSRNAVELVLLNVLFHHRLSWAR